MKLIVKSRFIIVNTKILGKKEKTMIIKISKSLNIKKKDSLRLIIYNDYR